MAELKIIEKVTDELIEEIVERIVRAVDPEKIIIFGSYARGETRKHSDLDILVIKESELPRYKRSVPLYSALADIMLATDIFVYTPHEIEEWKHVPQAFITTIVKEGRVVYEKQP